MTDGSGSVPAGGQDIELADRNVIGWLLVPLGASPFSLSRVDHAAGVLHLAQLVAEASPGGAVELDRPVAAYVVRHPPVADRAVEGVRSRI